MNQKSLSSNTWIQVNCFLMFVFNRYKCCEPSNELHRGTTQWTVDVSFINTFFPSPIPDSQLILVGSTSSRRRFSQESLILSTVREKKRKENNLLQIRIPLCSGRQSTPRDVHWWPHPLPRIHVIFNVWGNYCAFVLETHLPFLVLVITALWTSLLPSAWSLRSPLFLPVL